MAFACAIGRDNYVLIFGVIMIKNIFVLVAITLSFSLVVSCAKKKQPIKIRSFGISPEDKAKQQAKAQMEPQKTGAAVTAAVEKVFPFIHLVDDEKNKAMLKAIESIDSDSDEDKAEGPAKQIRDIVISDDKINFLLSSTKEGVVTSALVVLTKKGTEWSSEDEKTKAMMLECDEPCAEEDAVFEIKFESGKAHVFKRVDKVKVKAVRYTGKDKEDLALVELLRKPGVKAEIESTVIPNGGEAVFQLEIFVTEDSAIVLRDDLVLLTDNKDGGKKVTEFAANDEFNIVEIRVLKNDGKGSLSIEMTADDKEKPIIVDLEVDIKVSAAEGKQK
jgi:hypothetical protein